MPFGYCALALLHYCAELFLASDDANWMTGVVMPVDGGVMAGRQ